MSLLVRCRDYPTSVAHYGEYREHLRRDFWFSCAYCTTAEVEATGIGFEIDHYVPASRDKSLLTCYKNLMWCCEHCNSAKRNHPTPKASEAGFRFFNPETDNFNEHFGSDIDSFRVTGLTREVGEYTERVLILNRRPLLEIRQQRKRVASAQRQIVEGFRALQGMALDTLPKESRARVLAKMAILEARADRAQQEIVDFMLSELNRSPLLDRDPNAGAIARERRDFLRSCDAIAPPETSASPRDEQQEGDRVKKRKATEKGRRHWVRRG